MSRLNVGIIGAGHTAGLHAKGYEESPDAQIIAVCDIDEDLAIRRSLDWGARRYYKDVAEMLKDPEIDAVEIITPHALHAPIAIAALNAGKHVSMERPIATTIADAGEVLKAAEASGKILQAYEPSLFYKPLLDARSLIDAGEIGTPTGLRIAATIGQSISGVWNWAEGQDLWRFDLDQAGGSPMLFDIGYQAFAISLFLIGSVEKIDVLQRTTKLKEGLELDAPSTAMWKHFQSDCLGSLSLSYAPDRKMRTVHHPLEFRITVGGTRGEIEIIRSSEPTQLDPPVVLRRDGRRVVYGQKTSAFEDSFVRATQNFINACHGKEEPLLRGAEARQLLILTLAYYESAKRGRSVSLQQG